jgi:nitroreductase
MLWPLLAKTHPLEHLLVIRNVVGVESGIYQAGPDEEMIRRFDLPEVAQVEEMVLQPEFALAPMLFLTVGSLERALEWAGDHGHRVMLERSGAASEAAWLAAVDLGLGGSIFAGFLPSALRQLAGIDGFRQTQLLALAIGEPLAGAQPSTSLGISA